VAVGGIASLAIDPSVRGQGLASALLAHVHGLSDLRGDALTMLYAFRQGFYARRGYGTTASRKRLAFSPSSVPAAWRALARGRVRRPRGHDAAGIAEVYARAGARASGWLARSEGVWERSFARERTQFLVAEDPGSAALSGYVAFELSQDEPHAATVLRVEELAADDADARLALLGALGALRDQVAVIELEVDASDPLELALLDSDAGRFGTRDVEHALGTVVGGPMVRVEDVPRAFEARGYAEDGAFDVVLLGDDGREELAVSVRVLDGRAEVAAARGAAGAIRTSRSALASLLYGGLRLHDAQRLHLAVADPRTVARVDAVLALPPLAPVEPF
jgi:predicted acetyltransferase